MKYSDAMGHRTSIIIAIYMLRNQQIIISANFDFPLQNCTLPNIFVRLHLLLNMYCDVSHTNMFYLEMVCYHSGLPLNGLRYNVLHQIHA